MIPVVSNPILKLSVPRISVIVAAYNIADYIGLCIASILDNISRDYEVIVVDDGSTDDTSARIAPYLSDDRLRYIYQQNGGQGAARNTGLDHAKGSYIQFVDGDDWLEPGAIDKCVSATCRRPDVEIFVFDYFDIRNNTATRRYCHADFWGARNAPWNKVFRRKLIGESRFDVDILYEDLACVRPWIARAAVMLRIPEALYNYRNTRPGSAMNSRTINRFFELFTAAERCVKRVEEAKRLDPNVGTRLGADWMRRFYTVDVFVPGVIYWGGEITDNDTRHIYIAQFISCMPYKDLPDALRLAKDAGIKIAAISELYRLGAYRTGDFLLRDIGRYRRKVIQLLGRPRSTSSLKE